MHFILVVSILFSGYGSNRMPSVTMQEFNTYQACAYAAGVARDQTAAQNSALGGVGMYRVNAVCLPKG
jgi:hypothetical protein